MSKHDSPLLLSLEIRIEMAAVALVGIELVERNNLQSWLHKLVGFVGTGVDDIAVNFVDIGIVTAVAVVVVVGVAVVEQLVVHNFGLVAVVDID